MLRKKPGSFALILFILILACSALACNFPLSFQNDEVVAQVSDASPKVAQVQYMTVGPDASATPTPFQPVPPTPTPVPTNTPTPTPTPTLAIGQPNGGMTAPHVPVQDGGPLPDGIVNILVMGSDARPGGGFRTDVMMMVSINRNKNSVSVISVPRDLYIDIPGWQTNRINTAMQVGGFSTMSYVFESNFGVRPNYYVMTNFDGFKGIIDSMKGITVKSRAELYDACDLPWADGKGYCYVPANETVPMDGASALWYVRSRHSTSDFDRLRRAQEVLQGIFMRLMRLDVIGRAPEIFAAYQRSVETNLTLDKIIELLPVAKETMENPDHMHRFTLTPAEAVPYVTPEGAMVLWPNLPAIRAIFREAVFQ
jgi:polyisoprenyl-teichoic acid--peptidoglycan teichoic acid transferase